jgi:DNA-binding PadR family transcriptional regulator
MITRNEEILPLTPQVFYTLVALAENNNLTGADITREVEKLSNGIVVMAPGTAYKIVARLQTVGLALNIAPNVFRLSEHGAWWLEAETTRLEKAAAASREALLSFGYRHQKSSEPNGFAELLVDSLSG